MLRALIPAAAAGAVAAAAAAGCSWNREWDDTRYLCPDGTCPAGQECRAGRCEPAESGSDKPPWWDPDWTLRRPLLIDNRAAEPVPAGMAIGWVSDLDALVGPNHRDLQVVRWTGSEWIRLETFADGQPDTQETLWFELDADLPVDRRDSRHWVYYGYVDSPLEPTMDPPEGFGFDLWDSFDGAAIDPALWSWFGDVSLVAGNLVVGPGGQIRTQATWAPDHAVDIKLNLVAPLSQSFWLGFQHPDDDTVDDEPLALWSYRGDAEGTMSAEFWMSTTGEPRWSTPDVEVPGEDAEHTFTVVRLAAGATYWHENELRLTYQLPDGAVPNTEPIQVRVVNDGAAPLTVERIRVRPAIDPAPALTLGDEQSP